MKNKGVYLVIGVFLILFAGFLILRSGENDAAPPTDTTNTSSEREDIEIIADNLQIPWDIAFLPDGSLLATERPGNVVHIESGKVFPIEGVEHVGEGGLLGIALHPQFKENSYVYLFQTARTNDGLKNRVVRYTYSQDKLTFNRTIMDNLPGARFHDGGRIDFGPDGYLYIAIGDALDERAAQDTKDLAGSILRITDEGDVPRDNPFGNEIYSYGHRNPQGLSWDGQGRLWSTEHGRSGVASGYDEINFIVKGGNYGWPDSQGDNVKSGTKAPKLHSGALITWAPASALFYEGSLFFGGLRGQALYEAVLNGDEVIDIKEHFKNEYGRIRSVRLGPDGAFYITTSNTDGRGSPREGDDKIIRINPALFE